jgi:hypothetical protein
METIIEDKWFNELNANYPMKCLRNDGLFVKLIAAAASKG